MLKKSYCHNLKFNELVVHAIDEVAEVLVSFYWDMFTTLNPCIIEETLNPIKRTIMNAQLSREFMEWEVNIAICTKTDVTPLIALGFDDNKSY